MFLLFGLILSLWPSVATSPVDLQVRVRIEKSIENRGLDIYVLPAAEGDYYHTYTDVEGEDFPALYVKTYHLTHGNYEIRAILTTTKGQTAKTASIEVL